MCRIEPSLPGLSESSRYVPQLAGWVNRLGEIRGRLRCRKCQEFMRPEREYAKFLARYHTTVVSCPNGRDHDSHVYLNHCWACERIIDSRESPFQVEGLHLCIACGSGPEESSAFTQADICPKCGMRDSMTHDSETSRYWICANCRHKIRLPANEMLTGPRARAREHAPSGS
jgi:hypothetical protein